MRCCRNEPHNTLRERMRVTKESYCWTCHRKMDPLGPAVRDVQPCGPVPNNGTRQARRHLGGDYRLRRPRARWQSGRRHRIDSENRGKRTRRTGLRPACFPILDGPQRNPQRRAGSSERVSRLQRQRRQHEIAPRFPAHLGCVSLPHEVGQLANRLRQQHVHPPSGPSGRVGNEPERVSGRAALNWIVNTASTLPEGMVKTVVTTWQKSRFP